MNVENVEKLDYLQCKMPLCEAKRDTCGKRKNGSKKWSAWCRYHRKGAGRQDRLNYKQEYDNQKNPN